MFTKENFEKEKIICAAIEGKKINERSIVEKLKKSLPNYMIPKELKVLGKFPVNKNNKLDRTALKKLFFNTIFFLFKNGKIFLQKKLKSFL